VIYIGRSYYNKCVSLLLFTETSQRNGRYQNVPGDIKDTTAQTECVTYGDSDVTVKKEVDNKHQLGYCVNVNDSASGISMKTKVNDIKIENIDLTDFDNKMSSMVDVAQTDHDSEMALITNVPDTDRPHPVLLVHVKQELTM
jgi:hypothetical protein